MLSRRHERDRDEQDEPTYVLCVPAASPRADFRDRSGFRNTNIRCVTRNHSELAVMLLLLCCNNNIIAIYRLDNTRVCRRELPRGRTRARPFKK